MSWGASETAEPAASLYSVTGTSFNTAIGRVAFVLGLRGPAIALDTACSSSLVAVHQAVTGLQRGDADLALAGGVHTILSGRLFEMRANAGMLSPDGQCHTFDASANGYVRGEGCGILVLKRLSEAEADGDRIWAVIRGAALNQDGASVGLTVPNGEAQQLVIEDALERSGLLPVDIDYVETHGTGTPVGDPIEAEATGAAYGKGRPTERPLLIGSVKTNLGHLEPAAGAAGLIKVILAMRQGLIPKHLHFQKPNPEIDWDKLAVRVTSEATPWPVVRDRPPRAGVSGFGWSGTNAHVVLEGYEPADVATLADGEERWPVGAARPVAISLPDAIDTEPPWDGLHDRVTRLLPISGKTEQALRDQARRYLAWLDEHSNASSGAAPLLSDLAWTASVGRSHFAYRAGVAFRDVASLREGLSAIVEAEDAAEPRTAPKVAFAFTGQASQWVGMGKDLYEREPVARAVLDRCDRALREERGASLLDVMFGRTGRPEDLDDPAWTQPAIYALECALTALWASVGVKPDVIVGHSMGEIAGAQAAGVFTLEEGLRFAAARGELIGAVPADGAMAAVFASPEQVAAAVEEQNASPVGAGLSVAVDNGAQQVVSGDAKDIEAIVKRFESEGLWARQLRKSPAYHSALIEPALDGIDAVLKGIAFLQPSVALVSSMKGRVLETGETFNREYWRRQAREQVLFRDAIGALADLDVQVVVEVGPQAVLGTMVTLNWPGPQAPVALSSLAGPPDDEPAEGESDSGFVEAAAGAYEAGLSVSFEGLFAGEERRRISAPGYPFQRNRFWIETERRRRAGAGHPLLGARHESPRGEVLFETEVTGSDPAWLDDHKVFGRVVAPGALYAALAAEAGERGDGPLAVEEFQIYSPLVLPQEDDEDDSRQPGRSVQVVVGPAEGTAPRRVEVFSRGEGEEAWTQHMDCEVGRNGERQASERIGLDALKAGLSKQDVSAFYRARADANIDLGPLFRTLQSLWTGEGEAVGEVVLSESVDRGGLWVHPILLDGCFQVMAAARAAAAAEGGAAYLPFGWERLWLNERLPERVVCHARMRESAGGEGEAEVLTGDLRFYAPDGTALGGLTGYTVKRATRAALLSDSEGLQEMLYEVAWQERPLAGGLQPADALAGPAAAGEGISPFADYLSTEGVAVDDRARLLSDLERLSRAYALAALEQLGWQRRRGEAVEAETLRDLLQIEPQHTKLVGRLLRLLRDGGVLSDTDEGEGYIVEVDAGDPLPDEALAAPEAFADKMVELYPHGRNELGLVRRSGSALAGGLRGTVDPLEILFRSEGPGVTEYYFVAPASRASNRLLADAVAQVVRDWTDGRRLRVLEVGAGTGSATSVVLPELPSACDYTFTDISAGFFAEAEGRFANSGIPIEYRPLDIEKEPLSQGFEPHAYDLIIGANVLHATRDLGETLAHCRELLAPSGQLMALENMRGRGWQDITFGLLDGWWRFADDYRPAHAMASPSVWRQALLDSGYGEVSFLGTEGADEGGPLGSSVFLAQGPTEIAEPPGVWVICSDAGGTGLQLAKELSTRNQTVVLAESMQPSEAPVGEGNVVRRAVEADSRESWQSLLEELPKDVPLQGVLHLGALDGHGPQASTPQLLEDVRDGGSSALALVQGLLDADVAPDKGLWFITSGAQALERDYMRESVGEIAGAALWGFGRAVAREAGQLRPRMLDLDPAGPARIAQLADELLYVDQETQVAYRDDNRLAARLVRSGASRTRLDLPSESAWRLMPGAEGLYAEPVPSRPLGPGQVRVAVDAVGLNFLDVLLSMGVVDSAEPLLGEEFCGRIVEAAPDVAEVAVGDRVVGLAFGTFGPEVVTQAELVAPAPSGVSAAALATIPSAFVSAGLSFEMANLKAGDRALIHTASGGVGLAAVQLAQAAGFEVFATASSPKQAYLRSLGIEQVFDSRTTDFGRGILEATAGAGVDMVLNSLTGPGFIEASLSCLASGGSFVEMGRRDIWSVEEMAASRPDVSYSILELDRLKKNDPPRPGAVLRDVMEGMAAGALKPPAHTRWPITEAEAAMDFMRSARHIGKNVLVMPPAAGGRLRPDRTYLVTGGLGGIGIVVAEWLADHGAGVIVLNGRRPPDPAAGDAIEALRQRGADVRVELADVTHPEAVDAMLARMDAEMPPLAGIIHSVGVLSDGALGNQTWERFEEVLWPKVLGAWRLHRATADRELDLFVLFSSITGVLGNSGQGNHAAANAFLDQLAAYRRSLGLPGQAIAWGAWSGLGEAEEQRERIARQLEAAGTGWLTPRQGLEALDRLVREDVTSSMVAVVDWPVFSESHEERPPFLEHLLASSADGADEAEGSAADLLSELRGASGQEREQILAPFLQRELQAVMRLPSTPTPTADFSDLGMDSLMAVELRNRLNRAFAGEYVAPNTVVFDYPNVTGLARYLAREFGEAAGEEAAPVAPAPERPQRVRAEDAVAIVGMGCRFPGGEDLASFWRLLEAGENVVTEGRQDGGSWSGVAGDPAAEESAHRRGAFLNEIDKFDARFFKIAPIEARVMDPQQRLLLETTWQALEDAGIDPGTLRGSRTGVYAGVGGSEYRRLIVESGWDDNYFGTAAGVTVGRIAFVFGLEGPAVPLDLACAGSLVAVHQGVVGLQRGEVDLALAGGVNAVLSTPMMQFLTEAGMLSRSGQCWSFDASADGYVRGEGCGVVVLKRLSEAEADGDRIWGVIRGSAVNQNGAGLGLTLPNGPAQGRVMEEALAQAGVAPSEVDYVEAHGPGTAVGDTVEMNAVATVYGRGREPERPLLIGSVKPNIGHLEAAGGVASLVKAVLAMGRGVIPKHLNFRTPNPDIDWERLPVRVTSEATDWPLNSERPPLAGVNAFGISGANAHLVVEGYGAPDAGPSAANGTEGPAGPLQTVAVSLPDAIGETPEAEASAARTTRLLPLSGKSDQALRELASRYLAWLDKCAGELAAADSAANALLSDMAWTASVGRGHFSHRAGVTFRDLASLRTRLQRVADATAEPEPRAVTEVAFAYTGEVGHWVGMSKELYECEPVARAVLDRCEGAFRDVRDASLLDVMFGGGAEGDLDDPAWAQSARYAIESAVTALWASVGIRPSVVVGHGTGRIAAAQAAGVFTLEDGLRLAASFENPDAILAAIDMTPPSLTLINGSTGRPVGPGKRLDEAYWRQTGEPSASRDCVPALADLGVQALVEVGMPGGLGPMLRATWSAAEETPVTLSGLQGTSDTQAMPQGDDRFADAVAGAYEAGLAVSFEGLFAGEMRRRISLPGYPFQRRRHWVEPLKRPASV